MRCAPRPPPRTSGHVDPDPRINGERLGHALNSMTDERRLGSRVGMDNPFDDGAYKNTTSNHPRGPTKDLTW